MAIRDMGSLLSSLLTRVGLLERRLTRVGVRSQADMTPTGSFMMWAGDAATPPTGYLLARGGTVLIADYPDLYAVLGTSWGGNGTTTFGVPDMRGRVPVGVNPGDSDFGTLNQAVGAKTHTLTAAQMPVHGHEVSQPGVLAQLVNTAAADAGGAVNRYTIANGTGSFRAQNAGGGGSHNNIQPSRTVNFIIKT